MDLNDLWYKEGLPFKCTGCGQCCTGSPGYVWISDVEVAEMAALLQISVELFVRTYTRHVHGRLALIEHSRTYDCVFLKERKCQVYSARPKQCRTFPWWPEHLKSRQNWEEAAKRCEGINHEDAPLVSLAEIKENL
jgi:Fe-S-cluster containining protein